MDNFGQIQILSSGLATCIQDTGRFGYRKLGVPISGAMDMHSAIYANQKLGNSIFVPVLEATMIGPELYFLSDAKICICGADVSVFLDNNEVGLNKVVQISEGQILKWGRFKNGCRSYLGISGGFVGDKILGSTSFLANTPLQKLQKGDVLEFKTKFVLEETPSKNAVFQPIMIDENVPLKACAGPEWNYLNDGSKMKLKEESFIISSQSDNIGYRLIGNAINETFRKEILTSAVMPGTVQLLPDGQLIVLMRSCQTTGGYPRILQIDEDSLNQLAQRRPGGKVRFVISAQQF
ncbi:MAG: biotin-dependent carboxyltransferase family protein [Saprospiraceae bacterium]|nr:biotin-dependent carboxyltransferase family protein [Saprospiraceae bacterium]